MPVPNRLSGPASLIVIAFAVPLVVAGCGASSSPSTAASTAATRDAASAASVAAFKKTANAICLKGDDKINRTSAETFTSGRPTSKQLARYATATGIPILEHMITRLRALTPPAGDTRFTAMLDTADDQIAVVKEYPSIFGDRAFKKTDQLAHAYGLPDC
jgi:hypothetical protein